MDDLQQKIRIYQLLKQYGNNQDIEYFEKLINTKNNTTTYPQKQKCPNINCLKEVNLEQIHCLEDIGLVFCDYCKENVE